MLTRRKIIWKWMALPKDKAQSEEYMQRIANAFFSSVTMYRRRFRLIRPLGEGIGSLPSSRPMRNSAELYRAPPTHMRVATMFSVERTQSPSKEYVQCYGRP
jgi:hypothetical protein